ncbi:MAG: methyltransferase domain-containing protein [Pseudomonadota bacterium]
MLMDVIELREFYASRLGEATENSISTALSAMWGEPNGEHFMGLGFPVPWMNRFAPDCARSVCLMPAAQGASHWPSPKSPATLLSHDDEFPFRDSAFDRILMVHFLEHAENANECLGEAWRVLSPGGKLIIVVPNRRGMWARFENTPFGTGKPYSRGQLNRVLKENQFTPEFWSDALHFPPSGREFSLRIRNGIERIGRRIWPVFGGAVLVCATKRLYQGIPVAARARRRLAVPVLVPQGTGRASRGKT